YQHPITISTKLQITEFRVSTKNEESYVFPEIPLIKLESIGVSINYDKTANKKYEASLDGIFTLNDGTKLKLIIVKSKSDGNDAIFANVYSIENDCSVNISNVVDTLLQSDVNGDDKWSRRKPEDMKSPKFVVRPSSPEAYFYIHLFKKIVALYVTIEEIGNAMLLFKKLNTKSSTVMRILPSEKWGYVFALKTSQDFQFKDLFISSPIVFNIDKTLSLTLGNLVLVSYQDATFDHIKEELNNIIKELDKRVDDKQLDDIISIKLPSGREDVYKPTLKQGVSLYSEINYKSNYILLENFHATIIPESDSPEIKVALCLGTGALVGSEFRGAVKNLTLYSGLSFEMITFTYKPSVTEDEIPKLSIKGMLNFKDLFVLDTDFKVRGNLNISQNNSLFEVESKTMPSIINHLFKIWVKVMFSRNTEEIILEGKLLFSGGIFQVLSINISQKIGIMYILHTFINDTIEWPDFPDITFRSGKLYYSKKEINIGENFYAKGLYAKAHIDFFGVNDLEVIAKFNDEKNVELIYADKNSKINLGLVKLFKYKISLEINKNSIDIKGFLKLFDISFAGLHLNYDIETRSFKGKINIEEDKPVLGINNPAIIGCWSETNKFMITKWPCAFKLSWDAAEFARLIENASTNSCQIISGLELNETFIGKFAINLKQLETQNENFVYFSLEGNYSIIVESEADNNKPIEEIKISLSIQFDLINA
ncbi:327_t:CDS:2, partial [Dentiscutata heterogama]